MQIITVHTQRSRRVRPIAVAVFNDMTDVATLKRIRCLTQAFVLQVRCRDCCGRRCGWAVADSEVTCPQYRIQL
jgi:hypothetical protein|tara:strand:- start:1051 stop:1272 length:222 start_codon:yes stop_codon:yes gene_type:complete